MTETPTRFPLWRRKHLVHAVVFLLAGLYIVGIHITLGDPQPFTPLDLPQVGGWAALMFGLFLLVRGRHVLRSGKVWEEYYDAILMAVGLALLVRTFVVEPFKIPSGSMIPTLLVGDYLFVNKSAYGYRIPFTNLRIWGGEGPRRGDIVVFEFPQDYSKDYIKRVVGLPGDHIVYDHKKLTINGNPVSYQPRSDFTYLDETARPVDALRMQEQLGDVAHDILIQPFVFTGFPTDQVVPPGHYFVMGDNRDNSNDSRFWGFVPGHRLVGRAMALFWSYDHHATGPVASIRWDRLFRKLE
ncbi:MAG: signal peptidase I [Magnetococcus sp. WYHC-3]